MSHRGIYKDKKGRWYIHTSVNGKTVTIRGFSSKKDADDNYDYAIEKWKQEHNFIVQEDLFDKLARDYVDFVRLGKSPRTADRERTQLRTFWLPRFEGQVLKSVYNFERLRIIYNDIRDSKELNVRKKHDVIYTFLQLSHYAYINHLISKEVYEETNIIFQQIKYVKNVEQERHIIPQCEIKAFLDTIRRENEKDYILFALLVFGGLRISELLGLCNDCFNDGKVTIKRQLLTSGILSDKLKTKQSYRSIPLPKDIRLLLQKYITNDKERFYKISHTQFKRLLYSYETKAKIPHYVPHEFRHTKCYELAKKCENISDVVYCAKVMGHSVSIFENVYCSHLDKSLESKFFD